MFPRTRFLSENHRARWEFTQPELLSGVDSYFIGRHIREWVNQVRRLRLSQIVEMFYSGRGIPVRAIETSGHRAKAFDNLKDEAGIYDDGITSACDRLKILRSIDISRLQEETYSLAQVLQFTATSMYIPEEQLRHSCDTAVLVFMETAKGLINSQPNCNNIPRITRETVLDLQVAIDGSRSHYENLQLINHVSQIGVVSSYGTNITVIHGTTGEIIANETNSITQLFQSLGNSTGRSKYAVKYWQSYSLLTPTFVTDPTTLNLRAILQTVLNTLRRKTSEEMLQRRICAPSHVVLIMAQGSRVGSNDFESAQRMITTTFQRFPDLYFIFVTNDRQSFLDMTKSIAAPSHWAGNTERFNELIYPEHFVVIDSSSISPLEFSPRLQKEFARIPKRIMAPFCITEETRETLHKQNILFRPDQFEDFVGPNQEVLYRISPYYFRYAKDIQVQFHGIGYGDLTICQSRGLHTGPDFCQSIKGSDVAFFKMAHPCPDPMDCQSLYYSVSMDVSRMRCIENDCRYPDQVRYIIRHSGLTCENNFAHRAHESTLTVIFLLFLISKVY